MSTSDYLVEHRLKVEDEKLHKSIMSSIFAFKYALRAYQNRFPSFTDHSILHSLNVLDYCNKLIGEENIEQLNAIECYLLIMSCYTHDIGMGVNDNDFEEFKLKVATREYIEAHPSVQKKELIRDLHSEFSAYIVEKYYMLFEMEKSYADCVALLSRGHRKCDLLDEKEFPIVKTDRGPVRIPYLAAVLRLADEIDVGSDRNIDVHVDELDLSQKDVDAFGTHESITGIDVQQERIVLKVCLKSPKFKPLIETLAGKIQETLDYCRLVADKRTDLKITQERVEVEYVAG